MNTYKEISIPSLAQCEEAVGESADEWVSRCFEISVKISQRLSIGRPVYGHWTGSIAESSLFAARRHVGWVQHGWILLPDESVLDPTRWVFENSFPYIHRSIEGDWQETCVHCGHTELNHDEECDACINEDSECAGFDPIDWPYDEGGNALREMMGSKPCPEYNPDEKVEADFGEAQGYVYALVGGKGFSKWQLAWVANLPLKMLAEYPVVIYNELVRLKFGAFIPIDNRKRVLGD